MDKQMLDIQYVSDKGPDPDGYRKRLRCGCCLNISQSIMLMVQVRISLLDLCFLNLLFIFLLGNFILSGSYLRAMCLCLPCRLGYTTREKGHLLPAFVSIKDQTRAHDRCLLERMNN